MNFRLTLVCLVLWLIPPTRAQPPGDWASLGRTPALSTGPEIQVRTTDGKRYRGRFQSTSDDGLVLITSSGEERLARSAIARVSVSRPGHRARNALIGLGAGAGGGLAIGAAADASCKSFCLLGNNLGKAIFTPLGALTGLLIGALLPTGGWRDVYRIK
jgi:hypothetical protein